MLPLGLGKDVLQYISMYRDAFMLICKNVLGVACEGSVEISIFYSLRGCQDPRNFCLNTFPGPVTGVDFRC